MTNHPTKPDELDEILKKLVIDSQYDWIPENYTAEDDIAQVKTAIVAYINEIIGEDEPMNPYSSNAMKRTNEELWIDVVVSGRNDLRAEQRNQLTQPKGELDE
jgi:hypothetical protein